jgi:hypothetical protein
MCVDSVVVRVQSCFRVAFARQYHERATRTFGEVVGDAAIDQPAERSVAARADDQNVEILTELCELLARLTRGNLSLDTFQSA